MQLRDVRRRRRLRRDRRVRRLERPRAFRSRVPLGRHRAGGGCLCARLAFDSPFLILTGGFDGRLALADAATAGASRGARVSAPRTPDKVTAARFDARGTGFASCGVDRVVKAWALREGPNDARDE